MNILHMKYAVEVAKAGSLNKASETLLIAVPNISRSIKELEADLGITIFDRTTKGMCLTHEGEEFIMVMEGIMEISYGKNTYLLEEGDSIYYDSIVPHHVHAYEGQAAKILAVVYTPI